MATNAYNSIWEGTNIDEAVTTANNAIPNSALTQTTGSSSTKVMSQYAITTALNQCATLTDMNNSIIVHNGDETSHPFILQELENKIPYTGATDDVDLDEFNLSAKNIGANSTSSNARINVVGNEVTDSLPTSYTPNTQQKSQAIAVQGDTSAYIYTSANTTAVEVVSGVSTNGNGFIGTISNDEFEIRTNNIKRISVGVNGLVSGIIISFNTTLPYTSWTGSSAPYTKSVAITGVLSTDKSDIDLDLSSSTYSDVATIQDDWSNVYRVVSSADTLTFYTSTVPTIDIPLQIKVVR